VLHCSVIRHKSHCKREVICDYPGQDVRLANYVCHRTDRTTTGGGTATLFRRGIVHHTVTIPGLTHLEATAIQVTLAGKPVLILVAYFSPSRPLIGAYLTSVSAEFAGLDGWRCQRQTRGLELAAEHETGKLLRDYADGNSCLLFGPNSPTTNPYNRLVTPDVLDIVITMNLSFPVYLTSCSAISSVHLPVLIDTSCCSSFHNPPDRPDFRRTDWASFQAQLEELIPFDSELHNEMAIDICFQKFSGTVLKALAASTPKRHPRNEPRPAVPARIQDEIRLKKRLRRQWLITREPL